MANVSPLFCLVLLGLHFNRHASLNLHQAALHRRSALPFIILVFYLRRSRAEINGRKFLFRMDSFTDPLLKILAEALVTAEMQAA